MDYPKKICFPIEISNMYFEISLYPSVLYVPFSVYRFFYRNFYYLLYDFYVYKLNFYFNFFMQVLWTPTRSLVATHMTPWLLISLWFYYNICNTTFTCLVLLFIFFYEWNVIYSITCWLSSEQLSLVFALKTTRKSNRFSSFIDCVTYNKCTTLPQIVAASRGDVGGGGGSMLALHVDVNVGNMIRI